MNTRNEIPDEEEETPLPLVAPARKLTPSAPLCWLKKGAADMRKAPGASLAYGLTMLALSVLIALFTWKFGTLGLYLSLATGFLFIGPILAIGLYSFSCQLEQGQKPVLGYCLREGGRHIKDLMVFALILLVVFLVWARAATMVHIFFPIKSNYSLGDLAIFLGIGSAVGAIFATVVFTASAFSLPMIMDRKVDAITAVITSANAVLRNKLTMLVWALCIFTCIALSFATALLGFVVFLPLLGHATWHAYRDTVDASAWPEYDKTFAESDG